MALISHPLRRLNLWLASLLLMSAAALQAQNVVSVETQALTLEAFSKPIRISGMLENKLEQTLAFKIGGLVRTVNVDEGQWVKAGQVLASLDLEEIDARVAKAQSVLANAERNLARFESLKDSNALSLDRLQQAQTQVEVARSDLRVARFNQRHAVIKAPSDGRVLKRFIEPNELVAIGNPAFVVAASQTGWVLRLGVSDKDIVRLQLGDQAQLHFDAYPQQTFTAKVSELAGRADQSQTFEVELRLENSQSDLPLLAGFIGHGTLQPSRYQQLVRLPLTAMVRGAAKEVSVYSLDQDNRAVLHTLPLVALEGGDMMVSLGNSGLVSGQNIVVRGGAYLQPGQQALVVAAPNIDDADVVAQ